MTASSIAMASLLSMPKGRHCAKVCAPPCFVLGGPRASTRVGLFTEAPPPSKGMCAGCGATSQPNGRGLLRCSKCEEVYYCGKDCQAAHWPAHKLDCRALRQGGAAGRAGAGGGLPVARGCSEQAPPRSWPVGHRGL